MEKIHLEKSNWTVQHLPHFSIKQAANQLSRISSTPFIPKPICSRIQNHEAEKFPSDRFDSDRVTTTGDNMLPSRITKTPAPR